MDLLAKSASWLEKTRTKYAAQDVHFLRGDSSVAIRATIGRSLFEDTDNYGLLTRTETRDYLILAADLLMDDVPVTPKPGDQIIEGGLEDGLIHEVADPPGQPCWRWSDQYHTTYRIHTKFVGRQPQIP
jgi:hypothetical protein